MNYLIMFIFFQEYELIGWMQFASIASEALGSEYTPQEYSRHVLLLVTLKHYFRS